MMQQQEQPLTVESLKRILANHDERLSCLENDEKVYGLDEIWTAKDVAQYAKISYGYFIQKKNAQKKYRAEDVIAFFKNRNKA